MKKNKRMWLVASLLLASVLPSTAAKVDTLMVRSPSMNKAVQVVVVVPDAAGRKGASEFPVVYLLHGYGGNATSWIALKPGLKRIADEKGLIFVCPDGRNSWYWDSPRDPSYRYETFVSTELVRYVDTHYPTAAKREARAITGLSMGGHGALWLAFRHKETFGACGSTSGGVDIRPFPQNWEMAKQLGEYVANQKVWDEHTVTNQLGRVAHGDLAIIIDCGEDDFFLEVNKELHQRLLARGIDHDFITRPGGHNGPYWQNAIDYQLLFFEKYFGRRDRIAEARR
ncbi:MAG: esterase family protein [Mediterranea sp.]|jgi:S-formylglutathione hydrolase FrmB|nr:esterase family protein [Mediterranea sp.]